MSTQFSKHGIRMLTSFALQVRSCPPGFSKRSILTSTISRFSTLQPTSRRKEDPAHSLSNKTMASQQGTVLVLGGRGKTATPIASLLHAAGVPFLVASRSTSPTSIYKQATFDWLDKSTYPNIWSQVSEEGLKPISSIWLALPFTFDITPQIIAFVEFAHLRMGVTKFVLMSASMVEKGDPEM